MNPSKNELALTYRISSYKTRGYYFFIEPSTAGIIRARVLFEGVDYYQKVIIFGFKSRICLPSITKRTKP